MGLDAIEKVALERTIDQMIDNIPELILKFKPKDIKKFLAIKNEKDFVMGFTIGAITVSFLTNQSREFTIQDNQEIEKIISERAPDMRHAISHMN